MARRVVVTGLGAVSPVGNDVPTMWKNMLDGVNGIETITAFDTSDLKVHIAGTVKNFEPEKYFEKREAKKLDVYCQYAIAAAQEAVDDSGILGKIDENRFGVYIGAGIGGLNTFINNTINLENGGPRKVSPFFIPMMIGNIATGNVAIRFNAKGVSLSVMSACATGTNSIGEAFHAIKDGYADAIIAGGAEAVVARLTIVGFQNMKALSTQRLAARRSTLSSQATETPATRTMLPLPIPRARDLREQSRSRSRRRTSQTTLRFTSTPTAPRPTSTTSPRLWR